MINVITSTALSPVNTVRSVDKVPDPGGGAGRPVVIDNDVRYENNIGSGSGSESKIYYRYQSIGGDRNWKHSKFLTALFITVSVQLVAVPTPFPWLSVYRTN
jgi:hypothetical protein